MYIWINGEPIRDSDGKPKPYTMEDALLALHDVSVEPEKIRNVFNDRHGTYDSYYVDKHGRELWITPQDTTQPVIR